MNSQLSTTQDTDERRLLRFGLPAAALYFTALAFAVFFFATSHPAFDAAPVEAAGGFGDNAERVAVGSLIFLLPLPFVILFLAGLGSVLRRGGSALASAVTSAGQFELALVASAALASSITATIGALDSSAAAGAVVKAVDGLLPLAVAVAGLARAVLLGGTAVLLRRSGLAGRGLVPFSWAVATVGLGGVGTFLSPALFGISALAWVLSWVWMGVLAHRLTQRLHSADAVPPIPTPALVS